MLHFSQFNVIISNPAIFLAKFSFMLITHHNIMTCNLESHAIAINVFWACDNHGCSIFFNGKPEKMNFSSFFMLLIWKPTYTMKRYALYNVILKQVLQKNFKIVEKNCLCLCHIDSGVYTFPNFLRLKFLVYK